MKWYAIVALVCAGMIGSRARAGCPPANLLSYQSLACRHEIRTVSASTAYWSGARTFRWDELVLGQWVPLRDGAYFAGGRRLATIAGTGTRTLTVSCDLPDDSIWNFCLHVRCLINGCETLPFYFSPGFCDAEMDCLGTLDMMDFIEFLTEFMDEEPGGDFNRDGAQDVFDLLDYLDVYNQACS